MGYPRHCPLVARTFACLGLQHSILSIHISGLCVVPSQGQHYLTEIRFRLALHLIQRLIKCTMTQVLPQELLDRIVDLVASRERNTKMQDLKSCSLAAQSLSRRSRRYILEAITIPSFDHLLKWTSEIDPTSGIPSYVRTITLRDNRTWQFSPNILAQLEPHLTAFDRLECLNLSGFHLHSGIPHSELVPNWFGRFGNTLKTLSLESCSLSPNAFQSILHIFPLLDNVSIDDDCRAVTETKNDRTLKQYPGDVTNFQGSLVTGTNTLQEFLPCLLMIPPQFHRLVGVFNKEGHQIVSACAPTLQILNFEGHDVDDIQITPIFLPELHTYEFWIGNWTDVEPMANHYFPLIKSAPNLSTIHIEVTRETKESDISFIRDSSGWKEVDLQLCRLAKGTGGTVTVVLDVVLSPELSERKDVFNILDGTKFLSEFLKAGGLIRFE